MIRYIVLSGVVSAVLAFLWVALYRAAEERVEPWVEPYDGEGMFV